MNETDKLRDEQSQNQQVAEALSIQSDSERPDSERPDSDRPNDAQTSGEAAGLQPQVEIIDLNQSNANGDESVVEVAAVEVSPVELDASGSLTEPAQGYVSETPDEQSSVDVLVASEAMENGLLADDDMAHASREELLTQNRELMGWVNQLEHALAECQTDFKAHLVQFQNQEDLLEARSAELLAVQSQNASFNRDVEAAQKSGQRQRILIETITAQLEASQERIAQMERECTLSQRRCADQAQQLLQAESLCRDLKSRLNRQQRHTLQFKAALEKSLEVAVSPTNFDLPDLDVEPMDQADDFFPRPKPVKPWSQQMDEADLAELVNTDGQDEDTEIVMDNIEPVFDPNAAENLEATFKSGTTPWRDTATDDARSHGAPSDVDGKAATRVSFVPPIVPTAPIPSPAGLTAAAMESAPSEQEEVEKSAQLEASVPKAGPSLDAARVAAQSLDLGHGASAEPHTPDVKIAVTADAAIVSSSAGAAASETSSGDEVLVPAAQANWPAPLVNPLRPAKKIGSLAAIDLPSFPKAPA